MANLTQDQIDILSKSKKLVEEKKVSSPEVSSGDYLRAAAQGLTFGFGDELEARAKSLLGGSSYEDEVSKIRGEMQEFGKARPVTSTALEIAGSIPTMFVPGLGLSRAAQAGSRSLQALKAAGAGALGGGIYGAGTAESIEDIPESALVGASVGGVLGGGASAAFPKVSAAASELIKEGVPLTPGQALGGLPGVAEQALSAFPITSTVVKSAKEAAIQGFGRASVNRALAPIGKSVSKSSSGTKAFDEAFEAVSSKYDEIIPKISVDSPNEIVSSLLSSASKSSDEYVLTEPTKKTLDDIIGKILSDLPEEGVVRGETLKRIESKLGSIANSRITSSGADDKSLGLALFDAQEAFRKQLAAMNPNAAELQKVNKSFANLIPIQKAVNKSIATGGEFTPKQLLQAMSQQSKRKAARGQMENQEFITFAQKILEPSASGSFIAPLTGAAMTAELMSGNVSPFVKNIGAGLATSPLYSSLLLPATRQALQAPGAVGRTVAPYAGGLLAPLTSSQE